MTPIEAMKLAEFALQCSNHVSAIDAILAIREAIEQMDILSEWDSPEDVHEALIGLSKDVNALKAQLAECQKAHSKCLDRFHIAMNKTPASVEVYYRALKENAATSQLIVNKAMENKHD